MAYDKNSDGTYTDLEYTKFPAKIDSWKNNEDLTASMLQIANDYKSALLAGDYANAQSVLNSNPELRRMMITAEDINKIRHALMAVERLFSEDIETYIKSFTDKATLEAEKATSSATSAALSEKNASDSKDTAATKASEANQLVENLKSLKGTLPSNFTEYTEQVAAARDQITTLGTELETKISDHNKDTNAHADIRQAIEDSKYILPRATKTILGGIKVGNKLSISADGTLSADDQEYNLPAASQSTLGGVKLGMGTRDLTAGSSYLGDGVIYLVYE